MEPSFQCCGGKQRRWWEIWCKEQMTQTSYKLKSRSHRCVTAQECGIKIHFDRCTWWFHWINLKVHTDAGLWPAADSSPRTKENAFYPKVSSLCSWNLVLIKKSEAVKNFLQTGWNQMKTNKLSPFLWLYVKWCQKSRCLKEGERPRLVDYHHCEHQGSQQDSAFVTF